MRSRSPYKRPFRAPPAEWRCKATRQPLKDGTSAQCMRWAVPGSDLCKQHASKAAPR